MDGLLDNLTQNYLIAAKGGYEWHELYANNMPCNPKGGIYTYFWFEGSDGFEFLKYTIQYCYRIDEEGFSHDEDGTRYYVLHEYRKTYPEKLLIPEPRNDLRNSPDEGYFSWSIVNEYGRFRYVFDDEETAKKVITKQLLYVLYPYLHLLSDSDREKWNRFVKENPIER